MRPISPFLTPQIRTQLPVSSVTKIRCGEKTQTLKKNEDLKGQTVAVVGLGVSGRAAVRLALARGANVVAIDKNELLEPLEGDSLFGDSNNLRTVLGECNRELLEQVDRVVVSPGVPLENYGLSALLHTGKEVISELDFASEILPDGIKILAVTGTNGKSTVSTFAGQMLHHLGIKAFVGGNLGNPLSEAAIQCLESESGNNLFQIAVVEVSSYQMELPIKYFCPAVAVVLNLTPDHLERHKTMSNYAIAKCRMFAHMSYNKVAVLPAGNQHLKNAFSKHQDKCNVSWIGDLPGVKMQMDAKIATLTFPTAGIDSQLQLGGLNVMGTHNYQNAAVAAFLVLGLDVGIRPGSINTTMEALAVPAHRMQVVYRDAHGVTWVDDSKATNVEATYVGLQGLREQKSVILLGGLAKVLVTRESSGFEQLVEPLKCHKAVVTFGASGPMIHKILKDSGLTIPCLGATNLERAVDLARSLAGYGDAIVLSPGCASFDEFRNFEHRGKVFQELAFSTA